MSNITEALVTIIVAVIGVAILAVIVSRKSNTSGVIQAAASGLGNVLSVATSPVTGSAASPNLSYPGGSGFEMPSLPGFGGGAIFRN